MSASWSIARLWLQVGEALSWAAAAAMPDLLRLVADPPATQLCSDLPAASSCFAYVPHLFGKANCLPGCEHHKALCYPAYQPSSFSPWPLNSAMSCWAERSRADARPLPPRP